MSNNREPLIEAGIKMEYETLRSEILKRITLRHQFLVLAITIASLMLGYGVDKPVLAFIFPPISALLAIGWAQNEIRIRQMARYIQGNIEDAIPGLGWEAYRIKIKPETKIWSIPLVILSPGGTFIITQLIAILLGVLQFTSTPTEWFLLMLSVIAVIFSLLLLEYVRQQSKESI